MAETANPVREAGSSSAGPISGNLTSTAPKVMVMARMKVWTKGRFLWTRTIGSTLVGEGLDSLVFITVAFSGVLPGAQMASTIVTHWLLKSVYEAAVTPLTYVVVRALKRAEGQDVYDDRTNFNPLAVFSSGGRGTESP